MRLKRSSMPGTSRPTDRSARVTFAHLALSGFLAGYARYAGAAVLGFLNALFLGPARLGTVKAFGIIGRYSDYSDLGAMNGLYRNLSMALGRGDAGARQRLLDTAFSIGSVSAILTVAIVWLL